MIAEADDDFDRPDWNPNPPGFEKAKSIFLFLMTLSLCTLPARAIGNDLDSFCHGFCLSRYETGQYAGSGKCLCGDYIPINLNQVYTLPKRAPSPKPFSDF